MPKFIFKFAALFLLAWSTAMSHDLPLTRQEIEEYYRSRVPSAYGMGDEMRARCPIHNGKSNTSFAIDLKTGFWYCHSTCGRGDDVFGLEQALNGTSYFEAKKEIYAIIGRPTPTLQGPQLVNKPPVVQRYQESLSAWRVTATYVYCDAAGEAVFRAVRKEKAAVGNAKPEKKFSLETPKDGGWDGASGNMDGVARLPYRLPQLLEAKKNNQWIWLAEGEKSVESLTKLGLAATCNPQGAGKWNTYRHELNPPFVGAQVVILPDNDDPGRKHALTVADQLLSIASAVKILELPHLPDKGDVVDWLATGGTRDELERLGVATPALDPGKLAAFKRAWLPTTVAEKKASEPQEDSPEPPPDAQQAETKKELSKLLQSQVLRFVKVGKEVPTFRLETKTGIVRFDSFSRIASQREFRSITAPLLDHAIYHHKDPEWVHFTNMLLSIQEREEADPEAELSGSTKAWLVEYLSGNPKHASWEDVLKTANADDLRLPHIDAGAICVSAHHLRVWCTKHLNENRTYHQVAELLVRIGSKRIMRYTNKPKSTITFYKLPAKEFPPDDYETDKTKTTPPQQDAASTEYIV